jgi:putative PIN family toxin of toxin-antitoxin system
VLSEFLLEEITVALLRPKLQRLVHWTVDEVAHFEFELRAFSEVVEPASLDFKYERDPDDIPVLATLIVSSADLLVTGDWDLLALRDRYPIETPAEFVRRL